MYSKKIISRILIAIMIFLIWFVLFIRINRTYAYEEKNTYHVGDWIEKKEFDVGILDIQIMDDEELLEKTTNLTKAGMDDMSYSGLQYAVVELELENKTDHSCNTGITKWCVECGGDGNGSSYLTDMECENPDMLAPNEKRTQFLIFVVSEEMIKESKKHSMKFYIDFYPEVNYIEWQYR